MAKVGIVGEPGFTQLGGLMDPARGRRVLVEPGAAGHRTPVNNEDRAENAGSRRQVPTNGKVAK